MNGSRRMRVAKGSGRTVQEVNQLLSQFKQMQKMMKGAGKPGMRTSFRSPVSRNGLTCTRTELKVRQLGRMMALAFASVVIGRKRLAALPHRGRRQGVAPRRALHRDPRHLPAQAGRRQGRGRRRQGDAGWIAKGATPTETVASLLKKAGVFAAGIGALACRPGVPG